MFNLPKLPYSFEALEPYIDAKTMEIHYTKHHQTYVNKLNEAVKETKFENIEISEILKNIKKIPKKIRQAVINHGGGHFNHSLFWEIMTPDSNKKEFKGEQKTGNFLTNSPSGKSQIKGKIAEEIKKTFGSFEKFKEQFTNSALGVFGSGWVWLVVNSKDKLEIISTKNQDSPLMNKQKPILGLDIWEHAFYLKHNANKKTYIEDFFHVINWLKVEQLFNQAITEN